MNKKEVRALMREDRQKIINKEELSQVIIDKITALDIYKKAKVIAIYNSMSDEVNTKSLIQKALLNKTVLLPKTFGDEMYFVKINEKTKYVKSRIGVMEPIGDIFTHHIDLIIIPGLSFDYKLNRLGFGMGYYDKFLKLVDSFKIGICFDRQLIDELPVDSLDISMDMVITEKRILKKV